jgi:hypothetical protein
MVASPNGNGNGPIVRLTVRQAMHRYIDYKHQKGQPVGDLISRTNVHILPTLGDLVVSELTAEQLRRWLATMAAAPAQRRAKGSKPQFRPEPTTDEEHRQRRASANRVRRAYCQPRRLGPQACPVREGRGGTGALSDGR